MAKELPFFKFFPGEWVTGDVTMVSMEAQGVFTNLCCYYWMRNCSISLANAKQRFSNNLAAFEELLKCDVVKVADDDQIVINFLDEQMNEFVNVSEKRAKAGSAGGKAKAKQLLNFAVANPSYKDKDKEEEKEKEEDNESLSPAIASTPSTPKPPKFDFKAELIKIGVSEQVAAEYMAVRKTKRATNTKTAFDDIETQIKTSGKPAQDCIAFAVKRSWAGFESSWMDNATTPLNNTQQKQPSMAESWGLK